MELMNVLAVVTLCIPVVICLECAPVVNVHNNGADFHYDHDLHCCEDVNERLDYLSNQLDEFNARLSDPIYSDFTVVFRAHAGNSERNLATLWESADSLNDDIPGAEQVDGTFTGIYKSQIVEHWDALDVKKVKFAFYEYGREVMTLVFNGVNSNKIDWFSSGRLIQTPYPDMLTSTFNFFDIHPPNVGACPQCRMWYISNNHGGCSVDAGWVAVTSLEGCSWDRDYGDAPRFLYSPTTSVFTWESGTPGHASVMAISIQTGVGDLHLHEQHAL